MKLYYATKLNQVNSINSISANPTNALILGKFAVARNLFEPALAHFKKVFPKIVFEKPEDYRYCDRQYLRQQIYYASIKTNLNETIKVLCFSNDITCIAPDERIGARLTNLHDFQSLCYAFLFRQVVKTLQADYPAKFGGSIRLGDAWLFALAHYCQKREHPFFSFDELKRIRNRIKNMGRDDPNKSKGLEVLNLLNGFDLTSNQPEVIALRAHIERLIPQTIEALHSQKTYYIRPPYEPKAPQTYLCQHCNAPFIAKRPAKYCSNNHRQLAFVLRK